MCSGQRGLCELEKGKAASPQCEPLCSPLRRPPPEPRSPAHNLRLAGHAQCNRWLRILSVAQVLASSSSGKTDGSSKLPPPRQRAAAGTLQRMCVHTLSCGVQGGINGGGTAVAVPHATSVADATTILPA